jgi:hypothetical protein
MIRHVTSVELAGKLCGVSRGVAYEQARPGGAIPTVRLGRRLVVPIARLAQTLGTTAEVLSETIDALEASGARPPEKARDQHA